MKDSKKPLIIAGSVFVILLIVIGLFHEFGHIIICTSNGYDYTLTFDGINFNTFCWHEPDNLWLYKSLGGIFGIIASFTPLLIVRIRNNRGLFSAFMAYGFTQIAGLIFETFCHDWYISDESKPIITIIMILIVGVVFCKYTLPVKPRSQNTD